MQCARKADVSRMLVIGYRQSIAEIVGRFEVNRKWDVDFAAPADDLAEILRDTRYDVVLVHLLDPSPELTPIRMLRAVNPDIKIILFVEQATTAHIVAAIRA